MNTDSTEIWSLVICNGCKFTFQRATKPFYLLQCGHIYCKLCVKQAQKKCAICSKVSLKVIPLEEPHMGGMNDYFKATDFSKINRIYKFQMEQIKIMQQRCIEIETKSALLKQNSEKVKKMEMKLNQAIPALNQEIQRNYNKIKQMEACEERKRAPNIQIDSFLTPRNSQMTITSESTPFTPNLWNSSVSGSETMMEIVTPRAPLPPPFPPIPRFVHPSQTTIQYKKPSKPNQGSSSVLTRLSRMRLSNPAPMTQNTREDWDQSAQSSSSHTTHTQASRHSVAKSTHPTPSYFCKRR